jgi:hypothetical protein
MAAEKNPVINLPVKITLTSEGIEWFIRHKKQLKRIRTVDRQIEYGVSLNNFSAASLQKMINIDYIASLELARIEFTSKRQEIVDLTKLIVYRIMYKKFGQECFAVFLDSPLIKRWNRTNPSRIIDADSSINQQYVENLLVSVAGEIPAVSTDVQQSLFRKTGGNSALSEEEKKMRYFLIDRFMISMPNIIWCVLVKSRGQPEYHSLIAQIRVLLENYLGKAVIAEYLALMIVELLSFSEANHYMQVAREMVARDDPLDPNIILNSKVRARVQQHMLNQGDFLYLTYRVSGKTASIGTENRLQVVLFNREREYSKLKTQIENKMDIDLRSRSLFHFYEEMPVKEINPELGLYYLSYLQAACEKQNVRFDSKVNQLLRRDLTIITLTLQF